MDNLDDQNILRLVKAFIARMWKEHRVLFIIVLVVLFLIIKNNFFVGGSDASRATPMPSMY